MSSAELTRTEPRFYLPQLGFLGWLSIVILLFWAFVVIFAPWLAPYEESTILTDQSFAAGPEGTSMTLGSDYLGRDLLSRLIYGARLTLGLALAATVLAFVVGVILGFMAYQRRVCVVPINHVGVNSGFCIRLIADTACPDHWVY